MQPRNGSSKEEHDEGTKEEREEGVSDWTNEQADTGIHSRHNFMYLNVVHLNYSCGATTQERLGYS